MRDTSGSALGTVLLLDRTAGARDNLRSVLHAICEQVLTAENVDAALPFFEEGEVDMVIVSETVPAAESVAIIRNVRDSMPAVPVVVVSSDPSVDLAMKFGRAGAHDLIEAPLVGDRLERLVAAAQAGGCQAEDKNQFFSEICPAGVPMVGHSRGIAQTLEKINLVAESGLDQILILGETGVGKELAARAVHVLRGGKKEGWIAVNCAAFTANLLESELFGHVKGAFTGADRDKTGLFELAEDGTILLDEVSEMPMELQAKLLRVLQERTFRKVGGTKDIRCDATIIASSNRNLFHSACQGEFRKDLYYRLAVFPITVPPLRSEERRDDIPLLAGYFLSKSKNIHGKRAKGFSPAAQEELLRHDWPGNVRELKNVVERALILEKSDHISVSSLTIERDPGRPPEHAAASLSGKNFSLEAAERELIIRALRETGGQKTRAAALLGISRATLHAKVNRYEIAAPEGRRSQNRESARRERSVQVASA